MKPPPRRLLVVAFVLSVGCLTTTNPAVAALPEPSPQDSYHVAWSVVGSAGAETSDSSYQLRGTLAQPVITGHATAESAHLRDGFWSRWWLEGIRVAVELPHTLTSLLFQNVPNPFCGSTTIVYSVAEESPVEILVFDIQGRCIRTLVKNRLPAGEYTAHWDGRNDGGQPLASGIYFYRIEAGDYWSVKKMLMLK